MNAGRERAVVIGGSIAGLLAAAALSETFAEVVVIDRDELATDEQVGQLPRRGVPQGEQIHHLLTLGRDIVEELVPGLDAELLALGSRHYDEGAAFAQYLGGFWRVRASTDLEITCFRRPVFEWVLRRRVFASHSVRVCKAVVSGLRADAFRTRVTGVAGRGLPAEGLAADLVVDASGRGSRSPLWMEDLGYRRPEEAHLRVYMGYSAFEVRLAEETLPAGLAGITCGSSRERPTGASLRPTDNGNHIVATFGMMRNYPPTDVGNMASFLDSLPTPSIARAVRDAELLGPVRGYQMPGNQRRYWERLPSMPERFVVLGDAVASFDPLFGQGMTTAALGARVLRDVLRDRTGLDGVGTAVLHGVTPYVDIAFETAVSVDAGFEGAEFDNLERPTLRSAADTRVLAEVQTEDVEVMTAARRAALFMDPSRLQAPEVVARIRDWAISGRRPRPEMADPTVLPGLRQSV